MGAASQRAASSFRFGPRADPRIGALLAVVTLLLFWAWANTLSLILANASATAIEIDFRVFWGAARLALDGDAAAAFDLARLAEAHDGNPETWLPWVYPPGFLMLLLPFGMLSFYAAWLAFTALSTIALVLAARLYTGEWRLLWIGVALSPAILPAILLGQVSVLWAAGLLAALAALRAGYAVSAGILLGLLTLKPQLGLLVAVALLAGGHWRSIASATGAAIVFHAVATGVFGFSYWPAFLDMAAQHAERMRDSVATSGLLVSPYAAMVGFGLPERVALVAQWMLSLAAVIAVWVAWRRPALAFDARAAILVTAIPLASPYLWYGETALLAPALLILLHGHRLSQSVAGGVVAGFMAIGLAPIMTARLLWGWDAIEPRLVAAPLLVLAFAVAVAPLFVQGTGKQPER